MTARGERQKDVTEDYRGGWDRIWGEKEKPAESAEPTAP